MKKLQNLIEIISKCSKVHLGNWVIRNYNAAYVNFNKQLLQTSCATQCIPLSIEADWKGRGGSDRKR